MLIISFLLIDKKGTPMRKEYTVKEVFNSSKNAENLEQILERIFVQYCIKKLEEIY